MERKGKERKGEARKKQERLKLSLVALNTDCQEPPSTSLAIYGKGRLRMAINYQHDQHIILCAVQMAGQGLLLV